MLLLLVHSELAGMYSRHACCSCHTTIKSSRLLVSSVLLPGCCGQDATCTDTPLKIAAADSGIDSPMPHVLLSCYSKAS
jgi:uncharacterized lipoprotein YajG